MHAVLVTSGTGHKYLAGVFSRYPKARKARNKLKKTWRTAEIIETRSITPRNTLWPDFVIEEIPAGLSTQ